MPLRTSSWRRVGVVARRLSAIACALFVATGAANSAHAQSLPMLKTSDTPLVLKAQDNLQDADLIVHRSMRTSPLDPQAMNL